MVQISADGLYSLLYAFFCICFVVPPHEVAASGFTIQNMFGKYLGDERLDFIQYHTRRGSLTLMLHSLLPLGYCLLLAAVNPSKYVYQFFELNLLWHVGFVAALSVPIAAALCISIWSISNWSYHPLTEKLKSLMPEGNRNSNEVASAINIEIRRPNLFNSGHYSRKVYVTENWIVKIGTYSIDIVHQANCVLSLHAGQEYILSESSPHGVQILQIDVRPVSNSQKSFSIWLNSVDYIELRDHLQAPMVNARNVVVRQSVTEQFVQAFTETVKTNVKYRFDPAEVGYDLETCMGCMQEIAAVKLIKNCAADNEGECRQCYCRPLWCMSCMAKWFCNRQNQNDTSNWLSGRAPCPMCRATFCLADVCCLELI